MRLAVCKSFKAKWWIRRYSLDFQGNLEKFIRELREVAILVKASMVLSRVLYRLLFQKDRKLIRNLIQMARLICICPVCLSINECHLTLLKLADWRRYWLRRNACWEISILTDWKKNTRKRNKNLGRVLINPAHFIYKLYYRKELIKSWKNWNFIIRTEITGPK